MGINISCALAKLTLFRLPHWEIWAQKSGSCVRESRYPFCLIRAGELIIRLLIAKVGYIGPQFGCGRVTVIEGRELIRNYRGNWADYRQHSRGGMMGDFNAGYAPGLSARLISSLFLHTPHYHSVTSPRLSLVTGHWYWPLIGWGGERAGPWGIIECFYSQASSPGWVTHDNGKCDKRLRKVWQI